MGIRLVTEECGAILAESDVWNDAAATAANILASEQLWRLSFAAMLVMLACDVAVAAIFYVLFKPVNSTLSLIACAFRLVLVAIVGVAILGRYAPLLLLKDAASAAFETDQLQALGLLSIKMFERGFLGAAGRRRSRLRTAASWPNSVVGQCVASIG